MADIGVAQIVMAYIVVAYIVKHTVAAYKGMANTYKAQLVVRIQLRPIQSWPTWVWPI